MTIVGSKPPSSEQPDDADTRELQETKSLYSTALQVDEDDTENHKWCLRLTNLIPDYSRVL